MDMILAFLSLVALTLTEGQYLNWDPGMTVFMAAYWDPFSPYYYEDCPHSSNGLCYGTMPKGSGFYTFSYDASGSFAACCTPNTGMPIPYSEEFANIAGQPCPYYYNWGVDQWGSPFSRLDLQTLSHTVSDRFAVSLQENMNSVYDGLPPSTRFPAWNLRYFEVQFRAKVCYPQNDPSHYAHGIAASSYMFFYDEATGEENQIRLNFLQHWSAPAGSTPPYYWNEKTINEADVGGNPDPTPTDVWLLNGYLWGFTPSNFDVYYDTHTGCSTPLDQVNWLHFSVDMHQIFNGLIADGHVTRSFFDSADWIGGTVSAVESWGQSVAQADVKGYYLLSA